MTKSMYKMLQGPVKRNLLTNVAIKPLVDGQIHVHNLKDPVERDLPTYL